MSKKGLAFNGLIGSCWNFDPEGRVTVVIVPHKLLEHEKGVVYINWACSMGRSCSFGKCLYSNLHYKSGLDKEPETC